MGKAIKKIVLFLLILCFSISLKAQSSDIKCRIWKPQSFCKIPDSLTTIKAINCYSCTIYTKTCSYIDSLGDISGVWITIPKSCKRKLKLQNEFVNINLIRKKTGMTIHPFAILNFFNYDKAGSPDHQQYITGIKAVKFIFKLKLREKLDLFLIFKEAEIGDKIVIDNYLVTEIQY